MYRRRAGRVEVLLVHPGGPYWAKKDLGAWSVPKGEYAAGEDPLEAARREFREETGLEAAGPFRPLGAEVGQRGGKLVSVWAFEGDCDPSRVTSNTFTMEWPPRSGRQREFPEIDRAEWFTLDEAERRVLESQVIFLKALQDRKDLQGCTEPQGGEDPQGCTDPPDSKEPQGGTEPHGGTEPQGGEDPRDRSP
jgi:predicted NUDIX family NTP pyrophosphohydrolase